jgi:hypothetical protein
VRADALSFHVENHSQPPGWRMLEVPRRNRTAQLRPVTTQRGRSGSRLPFDRNQKPGGIDTAV